jgi:hypothetical protein
MVLKGKISWVTHSHLEGITLFIKDFQLGVTNKLLCIFVILTSIKMRKVLTINL